MTRNGHRIVSTAPISPEAIEILEQAARVEISANPDEQSMLRLLDGTIGVVCRGEGKVTRRMIDACPSLRVIGRPGAGFDAVDLPAATARGIAVVYAPIGGFAVAEGAMAMLLAMVKQVCFCDRIVKDGEWRRRYDFATGDMTGHTLGIIGLGRIGSHLAGLAQPWDMTILGYDPMVDPGSPHLAGVRMVSLPELLRESDYVSIHVPLTSDTRGLINRERIAAMKRGAILLNSSRGEIVESLDVIAEALESGQLSAAGLDVFPTEPPDTSHRLFRMPNFLASPHMLGVSTTAIDRLLRSMASDMVAVLEQRRPRFCVNPEVLV